MNFVMKVGEVINLPNIGYMISGNNSDITVNDVSKLSLINKSILVKTDDNEIILKVLRVKLSTSISDNLLIGLIVEEHDDFSKIRSGNLIYKIDN